MGFVASASRQGHPFPHVTDPPALFPVSVLCVNASGMPAFRERLGERFFAGRRTIGLWWWETTVLPEWMAQSFALVDEVWAGSAFVAEVLRGASDGTPVHHLDLPARLPRAAPLARAQLDLPEQGPLVLFAFDHNSVLERKNPLGTIEAFTRAVGEPRRGGPQLLVKSINGDRHAEAHASVLQAAGGRPDVHVRDGYLDAGDRDGLVAACDVLLSLHRAEGFGLTLAEALALGKPVVATGWSGSAEIVDERGAFPVRSTLRDVGPGNDPYPAEGRWAEPDLDHAAAVLREVLADLPAARARAAEGAKTVRDRFTPAACAPAIAARLARSGGLRARAAVLRRETREARALADDLRARRASI